MASTLEPKKIRVFYNDILRLPIYAQSLTLYEKLNVLEYAKKIEKDSLDWIYVQINCNPEYKYPEEYLPDRKFEYWTERYFTYRDAVKVIKAIDEHLTTDEHFQRVLNKNHEGSSKKELQNRVDKIPDKEIFAKAQYKKIAFDLLLEINPPVIRDINGKYRYAYNNLAIFRIWLNLLNTNGLLNNVKDISMVQYLHQEIEFDTVKFDRSSLSGYRNDVYDKSNSGNKKGKVLDSFDIYNKFKAILSSKKVN